MRSPGGRRGVAVLRLHGHDVADYVWEPDLPLSASPRPYLHPVRTLAGVTVTDAAPDSHPHQFGISVAAPDLDGRNFWGGRTFVAGHGPAWLDNHGTQRHQRWLRRTTTELHHTLEWADPRQATLLREHRSISCRWVNETAWSLSIRTRLTNATDRPLPWRSPAALGRAGAGFGGIFWRGPAFTGPARVLSPAGADVGRVHGRSADWVAVSGADREGRAWTTLFTPADEATARDRWFVRARDYLGVCSSPAWDEPLLLAPGETLDRHVVAVVIDGAVSSGEAAELADGARSAA
ncbi:oxidoreductase [Nonomuraea phyllanthi]|uniref:Oxidoreductase n=2 Tax=Nonomuraea phyllanthi TaxID=2219224 RepID=A0A5C4W6W2_9ACTN|nr:oxidoreductase [Nonomuraea phyllanthi]QFY14718.1 oxidoreductase [Nonomuraea phyllanthi]